MVRKTKSIERQEKTWSKIFSMRDIIEKIADMEIKTDEVNTLSRELFESISSLERKNILMEDKLSKIDDLSVDIAKPMNRINEIKTYLDQLSSKIESSSLNLNELSKQEEKIRRLYSLINQVSKTQEDINNKLKSIEKPMEFVRTQENKIHKLSGITDQLSKTQENIDEKLKNIKHSAKRHIEEVSSNTETLFNEINEKISKLERQENKLKKIDEVSTLIETLTNRINGTKAYLSQLSSKVESSSHKIEELPDKEDIKKLYEITDQLSKTQENIKNKLKDIKKPIEFLDEQQTKIQQLSNTTDQLSENLKNIEDKLKNAEKLSEKHIEKLDSDTEAIFNEIKEKMNELEKQDIAKAMKEINETKAHLDELSSKVESSLLKINELSRKDDIKKIHEVTDELSKTQENIKNKLKDIKKPIEFIQEQQNKIQQLSNTTNQLSENLRNIEERLKSDEKSTKEKFEYQQKDLLKSLEDIGLKLKDVERLNEIVQKQKNRMDIVNKMYSSLEETLKKLDPYSELSSNFSNLKSIVEKQNTIINDFINQVEAKSKVFEDQKADTKEEFLEKANNMLSWVETLSSEITGIEKNMTGLQKELEHLKRSMSVQKTKTQTKFLDEFQEKYKKLVSNFSDIEQRMEEQGKAIDGILAQSQLIAGGEQKISQLEGNYKDLSLNLSRLKSIIEKQNKTMGDLVEGMNDSMRMRDEVENLKEHVLTQETETRSKFLDEFEKNYSRLISSMSKIEEKIEKQDNTITDILHQERGIETEKQRLSQLETNQGDLSLKLSQFKSIVEKQNETMDELVKQMKEELESKELNKLQLSTKFYQILSMLPYVIEPGRVKKYLSEVKDLIKMMKSNGMWDSEKEKFMKNFLSTLSGKWKSRGYEEIGSAYASLF